MSNLGIYKQTPDGMKHQIVTPDTPYEQVAEKIIGAIDDFFRYKINHPENQPFDKAFLMTADELMNDTADALNNADVVTISGGEPLDQKDALQYLSRS